MLTQFFDAAHRDSCPDFGVGAGAEAFGDVRTDVQAVRRAHGPQRLCIRVGTNELYAVDSAAYHVLNGVAAAAAEAHDLDTCAVGVVFDQFKHCSLQSI